MHFDSHVDGFKYENPIGMPYYNRDDMPLVSKVSTRLSAFSNTKFKKGVSSFINLPENFQNKNV